MDIKQGNIIMKDIKPGKPHICVIIQGNIHLKLN